MGASWLKTKVLTPYSHNGHTTIIHLTAKRLLVMILSLQLALLGLIALDKLGLPIPILRQAIAFIYLTFVPGFLILKILKLHKLSIIETVLYSIGLSLSFLMFTGILINFFYQLVGISSPISETPIVITISIIVLILYFAFYLQGKRYSTPFSINLTHLFSPYTLFLSLLATLAIAGTYLLSYGSNLLILTVFAVISVIPLFVALDKVSTRIYPFAIWVIASCLVLYNSLYGSYPRLTDNFIEFYLAQNTLRNQFWDISIPINVNAMAGVMVNLPIYSLILKVDLVHLYKMYVPLLSSFIPLGLYVAFEKKFQSKIAFLSSFFFTSMFVFFGWASITMKMVLSGVFLSLLVLLITSNEIDGTHKKVLGSIFAFGLITSHYGTSYLFMFALITASVLPFTIIKGRKTQLRCCYIAPNFVIFFVTLTLSWYIYATRGSSFKSLVLNIRGFIDNLITEIMEFIIPRTYGSHLLFREYHLYLQVLKYLHIIAYLLILLGVAASFLQVFRRKELDEFMLISLPFLLFIPLPYLSGVGQYAGGRAFLIPCYFLSPFLVLGCSSLFKIKKGYNKNWTKKGLVLAGVFLSVFFLFNSGFASEVIWKYNVGPSVCVSAPRIVSTGTVEEKEYLDWCYPAVQDIQGAKWLSNFMNDGKVFCDFDARSGQLYLAGLTPAESKIGKAVTFQLHKGREIDECSYIFLNSFNIETGKITEIEKESASVRLRIFPELNEFSEQLSSSNKIYMNGRSEVYYHEL